MGSNIRVTLCTQIKIPPILGIGIEIRLYSLFSYCFGIKRISVELKTNREMVNTIEISIYITKIRSGLLCMHSPFSHTPEHYTCITN